MRKHIPVFYQKKKIVLFIWQFRCYLCGFQRLDNHVHHINENPHDNGSHNLIVLCKNCHIKAHKHIKLDNIVFPERVAILLWELDEIFKKLL